jgi:hypothetical protein
MFAKPTPEHEFYNAFIGDWTMEHSCDMGPGQPPAVWRGKASARSLEGIWTLIECEGEMPGGGIGYSMFTLGYDPVRKVFHGTFVGSMMTHLWIYEGTLNEAKTVLTLNVEGPSFSGEGMANYQDIFEIVDKDHWILRSRVQDKETGEWKEFLEGHHYRVR